MAEHQVRPRLVPTPHARSPRATGRSLTDCNRGDFVKFSIFNVPFALDYAHGEESLQSIIDWSIRATVWADEYGLDEAFYAEHYTLGAEPSPAPDLMIAAASRVTKNIKLGALGHLLPYHNPAGLAHRMMFLDHMTGGRYIAGVAPGAYPSDAQLFDTGSNNAAMMTEALDIIDAVFTKEGPWRIEGQYWTADMPGYDDAIHGPHLKPMQDGGFEFLMTGMQATSPTLVEAGKRGYSPVSQLVHGDVLKQHWQTYSAAAEGAGFKPKRKNWRILRDWLVADTDEEARELALNGPLGRIFGTHNLPTFQNFGIAGLLGGNEIAPEDVTLEWLIDNFCIVGSPETVARKIRDLYEYVGGFGAIVGCQHANGGNPEIWRRSWELTGKVVAPMLADLTGEA